MPIKISLVFAGLSGILMGLGAAPIGAWYLAWIALAPLWFWLTQTSSKRQIFSLTLAWGVGYYGLALFWITGVHPMTWMGVPWLASLLIALFCWLFITGWGIMLVTVWGLLFNFLQRWLKQYPRSIFWRVLTGATLWIVLETLWSHTPLWWATLAYTQSPHNLAILQLGRISGPNTITFILVLVNGLLAELVREFRNQEYSVNYLSRLGTPLAVLMVSHLLGYYYLQRPLEPDNLSPLRVGIVQGNVPNEIKLAPAGWRKAIAGYTSGYQRLARQGAEVVLTPETALPYYWSEILDDSSFYQAVIQEQVPVWVGANGRQGRSYTNSIFTLTGEGETYSRYDKQILVPLGEYIPWESVLGRLIDRLSPLDAHLAAGQSGQLFATPFGLAIMAICYESAFPQHFLYQAQAGGEFILTASNNAHYSSTMPSQHHALDVMRAIESDRWAARATNTGYSAIVDPQGRTLWLSKLDQYAIHNHTIYRRQTKTWYVRWGDWLTPTMVLFCGVAILIRVRLKTT